MESVLKTLKKKYGENNLIKILQDINPHLSTPQKKLNKKYITYTKFGSSPPGTPSSHGSPRDSPHTPPRSTTQRSQQTPPSGDPLRRSFSKQTQKSPYI